MLKLKKHSEKEDASLKVSNSSNKTSQAVKIIAHLKDLDNMIKNGGKNEKRNKNAAGKKKKRLVSTENQITSLKIISRIAGKVRDREVERQPFMDFSPDRHPHITEKNVDKLLYLENNTLATKKSLVRTNILHERETLQRMRGVCIYIKAKLPGAVEKFKSDEKNNYKSQKSMDEESQVKEAISYKSKDRPNSDTIFERDRKIEIDVTTIHSILGLSGLELLGDVDTTDITKIRHRLMHIKESINSIIPEVTSDYVIKGLTQLDPNKLIGLVPMLLSVVKNKYVNPNFWASVAHELWIFLTVFQHNNLKMADHTTEMVIESISNSSRKTEERLNKIKMFPDYFVAITYLFSGMVDTKIPGVLRLMVRLNIMYYFECRINSLFLFCKSPMELWIDNVKLSALLNNIDSMRTLLTSLSESKCIDIQQLSLRIFTSNLVSIVLFHLISSPENLVNEKNNVKLAVCFIEFLNECLLIGHSKELLDCVSDDKFIDKSVLNDVFGYGYTFYSELDANNIHLDKKDFIVRDYKNNHYKYSKVGYYRENVNTQQINECYNIWDIFSLMCDPKYSESILYPIILFLEDMIYFSFVYEINWDYSSLKNLLLSIKMLYKHFKKTTMEIGSDESLSSILLEDTKAIKKYLKLLYNSQNIDIKKVQEWITDRKIKESTLTRKLDENAKVPCFHPSCNNYTVGSKIKILSDNKKSRSKKSELEFRYCKGCFVVSYCSDKCQKSHWKLSHSTMCGLMSVPPTCLVFNSTVNWPIRLHLHSTKNRILETESVEYLQDKYYNILNKHLSLRVFFDLSVLSVPYPLAFNDDVSYNTEPYSCGLRGCYRKDCLSYDGLKESGLRRTAQVHNQLLVYRELHNNQKLMLQMGDPRMWNSYLDTNEYNGNKDDRDSCLRKKKKIYLTKNLANMYNILFKHK